MAQPPQANPELLDDPVRRIPRVAQARRIILFGSAAEGRMGANSDLDVLVVVPDGVHRRRTAQTIYRGLIGFGAATDVIVVTESDVHNHAANPSLVLCPALREGRELYRAAG